MERKRKKYTREFKLEAVRRWIEAGVLPGTKKKGPFEKSRWSIPASALTTLEEKRDAVSS